MNVGELRDALMDFPNDVLVVMSSDGEGNSKSPLADLAEMMYAAETTYSGDTYPTHQEIVDSNGYYSEEDEAPEGAVPVICLWPTN